MLFRNFYRCARCRQEWVDDWSCACDDDCPHCGARHMSPYMSEQIEEQCAAQEIHKEPTPAKFGRARHGAVRRTEHAQPICTLIDALDHRAQEL